MTEAYNNPNAKEPFKARLGRCYELAGRFASENPETHLIHGSIEGFGNPRIDHAWVELPDGSAWEPASNMEWPHEVFDTLFNPKIDRRMDNDEVLKETLRQQHWGPWTKSGASSSVKKLTSD